jgi:DNA-binding CsgD family transcriptional regulator
LIAEGLSDQEIGQRHGVSYWTVIGWRRAYSLRRSRPSRLSTSFRPPRQELAGLVAQGLSDQEIGERYGGSASTAQK